MPILDCLGSVLFPVFLALYTGILFWIAKTLIPVSGVPKWLLLITFPVILLIAFWATYLTIHWIFNIVEKFYPEDNTTEELPEAKEDAKNGK